MSVTARKQARAAVQELYRQALAAAGHRRSELEHASEEELARIGDLAVGALAAGMRLTEVASLAHTSRPTLYALRAKAIERGTNLEYQVLSAAAAYGGISVESLAGITRRPASEIQELCIGLLSAGLLDARGAASGATEKTVAYYGITELGEDRLATLVRELGRIPDTTFFAYLPIDPAHKDAIYEAALARFPPAEFAMIAPGTTSDMTVPELAFPVRAASEFEAHGRAATIFSDIFRAAGVEEPPGPIRLLR
jgi:hypothetical protein